MVKGSNNVEKMVKGRNNVEDLYKAGVLLTTELSDEEVQVINSLDPEEIKSLKKLKERLGNYFVKSACCSLVI
jgi:hypothetical protein